MLMLTDLEPVRSLMLDEIDRDISSRSIYISPRLLGTSHQKYSDLLREAARSHNDARLASGIRNQGLLKSQEERNRQGKISMAAVPVTAPEILAEGEFNRFYARGVCRSAIESGVNEVVIYRAKQVSQPRPESEQLIGKRIPAAPLLEALRSDPRIDVALKIPQGPNSGLSVRLP